MRAFVLLSALVAATVADPQHPAGGPAAPNNGCALIVSGPPKSSLFDQVFILEFGLEINLWLPAIESVALPVLILMDQSRCKQLCNISLPQARGAFGGPPKGGQADSTCITYDAVNSAFEEARRSVNLPPVRGKFTEQVTNNCICVFLTFL